MTNALINKLVTTKPRESSGSRSANRFDFQKDWAISELLRLHLHEKDYLLILDYHEDIIVLDSEHDPQHAIFYQIKSKKSGNWTVHQLCKHNPIKGTDSIFKKLFSNYLVCPDETTKLVFMSNQGIKATLNDDTTSLDHDKINFSKFIDKDKTKIHESIEGSATDTCDIKGLNMISVETTELTINSHDTLVKGILVDFFHLISPKKGIEIDFVYKTLFDEVKRRNNSEKFCSCFDDLRKIKGIGREEFEGIVMMFTSHTSNADHWAEANRILLSEGYKLSEVRKIKAAWTKYTVEIMNAFNESLSNARDVVVDKIQSYEASHSVYDLNDLISHIKPNVDFSEVPTLNGEPFIEDAAIIYEVIVNDPIQKTNPQFEEETV